MSEKRDIRAGERVSADEITESECMHYEGNCIRPPPEAFSILLQVTLGCSHNKCTFCGTYKDKRFAIKDDRIILGDILFAARHMRNQDRVFLMDGDALIIPQDRLVWILDRIHEHLPWVKGIGSYANTKSISLKTSQELDSLRQKGLDRIYLGVETGDDEIRKKVRKGFTALQCAEMGKRLKRAGMRLTVMVLLGIAGKEHSLEHAKATGEILSAMNPDHVAALTVIPVPGTPFWDQLETGELELPDEKGMLLEMREMLRHTNMQGGTFASNHASNYLSLRVQLPEGKKEALELLDAALQGRIGLKPEWMRSF